MPTSTNMVLFYSSVSGHHLHVTYVTVADINECTENGKLCLHGNCVNEPGSYKCRCDDGYKLSPDGAYCLGKY